jgi:cobalamin biosynthesis protein CobT
MESEDPLIGPASISELRKNVAICTQAHQTGFQIVPSGAYTDGSTIYVSPPPADIELLERWLIFEALTIHESWHILFQSDFALLRNFVQKYEGEYKSKIPFVGKIAHDIVNIIEDARIEYLGKKRFVGVRNSILFNNSYWLKKRPSFKGMKDWEMFIEGLLQLGVCRGLRAPIQGSKVKVVLRAANFYLEWAKNQEIPNASFLAAEKVMRLFLDKFKIEGTYSQQIPSPPSNVNFKPQDAESELSPEDVPQLPKGLRDELGKFEIEEEEPQKDLEKDREGDGEGGGSGKESLEAADASVGADQSDSEVADEGKGLSSGSGSAKEDKSKGDGESVGAGGKGENPESEAKEDSNASESTNEGSSAGGEGGVEDASRVENEVDSAGGGKGGDGVEGRSQGGSSGREDSSDGEGLSSSDVSKRDGSSKTSDSIAEDPASAFGDGDEVDEGGNSSRGEEGSQDLRIVNIDEIDPMKTGGINPAALRIKIDDILKRNYALLKDKELLEKARSVVKLLEGRKEYKKVFYTKTFDIGVEIETDPTPHSNRIFTSVFDSLRSLIQVTINQFKALFKSGSKTTSKLKFGRLDSRKMVRGLVNEDPHIFKKNIQEKGKNEIAIALLIDQSGSMHGEKIANAQKAAILFGEVLDSLDIHFSIYGWTDIMFQNSSLVHYLRRKRSPVPSWTTTEFPPEINDEILTVYCFKEFDQNYAVCKNKLGLISAQCDNSDHNAIEFMTEVLLKTKKRVKILMVLSDGQPAARSYEYYCSRRARSGSFSHGLGNVGINLTRQAIENAQQYGIQTLCVSVDKNRNYQEQIYGQNNYIVVDPSKIQELPVKVAKLLSLILRRAGVKF